MSDTRIRWIDPIIFEIKGRLVRQMLPGLPRISHIESDDVSFIQHLMSVANDIQLSQGREVRLPVDMSHDDKSFLVKCNTGTLSYLIDQTGCLMPEFHNGYKSVEGAFKLAINSYTITQTHIYFNLNFVEGSDCNEV